MGGAAGAAAFAVALLAGYVLYRRLLNGSTPALAVILLGFAAVGAYAGWLLGVLVFSALRGQEQRDIS